MEVYKQKRANEILAEEWTGEVEQYISLVKRGIAIEDSYDPFTGSITVGLIEEDYESTEHCTMGQFIVELFTNTYCIMNPEDFHDNYVIKNKK